MESRKITATELARSLSDVLSSVYYRGETYVIERNGRPVATLTPPAPRKSFTFGDLVALLRDLPRPDDQFADDLEKIQASQQRVEPRRWDS